MEFETHKQVRNLQCGYRRKREKREESAKKQLEENVKKNKQWHSGKREKRYKTLRKLEENVNKSVKKISSGTAENMGSRHRGRNGGE